MCVSTALVPDASEGDWLLVHAGFAIQQLDEQEAEQTWAILNDLNEQNSEVKDGE